MTELWEEGIEWNDENELAEKAAPKVRAAIEQVFRNWGLDAYFGDTKQPTSMHSFWLWFLHKSSCLVLFCFIFHRASRPDIFVVF